MITFIHMGLHYRLNWALRNQEAVHLRMKNANAS